jgi:hypothetical protein
VPAAISECEVWCDDDYMSERIPEAVSSQHWALQAALHRQQYAYVVSGMGQGLGGLFATSQGQDKD